MKKMDESTKKKYEAWKRRKILKLVAKLGILILVLVSGFIFGLRSCGFNGEGEESQNEGANSENNLHLPFRDSTEEIDPMELDDPINDEQMGTPIVFCGFFEPDDVVILTDEQALSHLALVNNCYRLSGEFSPGDLSVVNVASVGGEHLLRATAARAAEELFAQASEEGHILLAISGFRSFSTQESTHNYWINKLGVEQARRLSARPGHSEHQLGLALDVSTPSLGRELSEEFASTPEGMWVDRNAHRFGFIISYPNGREADTGFSYEPWHIRYVGVEAATEIFNNNQILEEYLWYIEEDSWYIEEDSWYNN